MLPAAAPLNAACLHAFGVPAVLQHGGATAAITAVYSVDGNRFNNRGQSGAPGDMALDGAVLEKPDATLTALTDDLGLLEDGDTVTVEGRTFRVVDIGDDRDGMRTVTLRAAWR